MTTYDQALKFVLQWEGGYVNDPHDHGGPTNKGITERVYDAYLRAKGQNHRDVKAITDAEVADIYRNNYWITGHSDKLTGELAFCHFDTAVNMGTNRAVKILQRATGCAEDGVFGGQTLAACQAVDEMKAVKAYCDVREVLYKRFASRPGQSRFLKGWMNRLNSLRVALKLRTADRDEIRPENTMRIPDIAEGMELDA